MKNLLAALLLAPAILLAQGNPNYDPDYNGDGCFSITDVLGLLPLFGSCVEADTPWACGDSVLFDSYWYETVLIGEQCWFAENLRTTQYANGDNIPVGLTDGEWTSTTVGATAIYGEGNSYCTGFSPDIDACDEEQSLAAYGRLYNWYAVDDVRGVCPEGWHVPVDEEWLELEGYLVAQGFAGDFASALSAVTGWSASYGSDDFGWSGYPGGYRNAFSGSYGAAGSIGYYWTSTYYDENPQLELAIIRLTGLQSSAVPIRGGQSVRCLNGPLQGCTDSSYIEFNPSADLDDGSCLILIVEGCMDSYASNYEVSVNVDNGSCLYPGCTDPNYVEYDSEANVDDGSCSVIVVPGCTDADYLEFNPASNTDDGTCLCLVADSTCVSPTLDGYSYDVTQIGCQCWFAENLRTSIYTNGDSIPANLNGSEWVVMGDSGATAIYGEPSYYCADFSPSIDACDVVESLAEFGRLYNLAAVQESRGICPVGWHVPTNSEWNDLHAFVSVQGGNGLGLKSTSGWVDVSNGTDDFGFTALPGGMRNGPLHSFGWAGAEGYWWTSTLSPSPVVQSLFYNETDFSVEPSGGGGSIYSNGYSVRCIKNTE